MTTILLAAGCAAPAPPAAVTRVLVNGRIWTGDPGSPWTEALAIAGGRIVATGASDALALLAGDAETIDLRRGLVLPGFIDTHTDLFSPWLQGGVVDLSAVRTPRELATRLAAAVDTHAPGAWLLGRDWDQRLWGGTLPDRSWIDDATPDHPVWLLQRGGHLGLANRVALERVGIAAGTPGARIWAGAEGEPLSGILEADALRLMQAALPVPTPAARDRALTAALAEAAARGVTSVHHLGGWSDLAVLARAEAAGRLTARVYAAVPLDDWLRLDRAIGVGRLRQDPGDDDLRFRVGAVHATLDGSLAAGSAAFETAYAETPGARGRLMVPVDRLTALVTAADRAELQVWLGATGDRAARVALDLHAGLAGASPRDRRFRIETAQHLRPLDIARFGVERVLVSALPFSALHEGRWIEAQLGAERARTSFPFRALLDTGALLSFGSGRLDAGSPIDGIYAAATRRTLDGLHPQGWVPIERIDVEEALRAYTSTAAYVGFAERRTGRLTVGHWADLILVDRDLLTLAPTDLPLVRVVMTMVGGEIVFDARR